MKINLKTYLSLKYAFYALAIIFLFCFGWLASYFYFKSSQIPAPSAVETEDPPIAFLSEIYNNVKENYWDNLTEPALNELFKLAAEKLTGSQLYVKSDSRSGLMVALAGNLKNLNQAQKNEFSSKLAALVLANLNPAGHNGLYTEADEKNLANRVQNVKPDADLYADLGVEKNAAPEKIETAYQAKAAELKKQNTEQAREQLTKINRAYETLSNADNKQRYDKNGAQPTVFSRLIQPDIFYAYIKSFSPATLDEFIKASQKVDRGDELTTMILDLRGNIGGSIDILPYLLGPFIGPDQYAYEFYQQGRRTPFKTVLGWQPSLVRYKKVIILVDKQTQSTAEMMAAVLKKYNIGILMGEKTAGWGTVERIFSIKNQIDPAVKYSMFLVHHLTLRDDNQPIQNNGVEPVINLADPGWKNQLYSYFRYPELVDIIEKLWQNKPGK